LALGGSEAETWKPVSAIEWQPESAKDVDIRKSAEDAQEGHSDDKAVRDGTEWFEWPEEPKFEWFEETSAADAAISERAESTTERRPGSRVTTESSEWVEWPEEAEFKGLEKPEESTADAGFREAVKYLLEEAFEGAEKASADWRRFTKRGTWADAEITGRWRSEESYVEWHARVATGAGKLEGDLRKLEEATRAWRRSSGALSWWKKDRAMQWRHTVNSWKRHRTSGEMRRMRMRRDRAAEEAARAWRVAHGSAGERE
jgi:hypothetical protein